MRDPKRIPEILKRLEVVWKKYPDLRLGQLLIDVLHVRNNFLFYIEDNKLIEEIEKFQTEYVNK